MATMPAPDDPCAEARRIADERCAVATRAREHSDAAHDALRAAQRSYDDHVTRAERAATGADQRAMRAAKEAAQQAFRRGSGAARTRDATEAAARDWLTEINRINHAARDAALHLDRERQAASALGTTIERLIVEADAARTAAETAEASCRGARRLLADCEGLRQAEADDAEGRAVAGAGSPAGDSLGSIGLSQDGQVEPAILQLLRGQRATLARIVDELAGGDQRGRRRWQLALAELVDAIVARSIEASTLVFPTDHPFWGEFTRTQARDIASALGSLGYRFDGLGGWADERIPSQRDLSLAVGYAGVDPMRIRRWPTEEETTELYRDVAVAADEFLASVAGGLTLGELVGVLGHRADSLTDIWNNWDRVRSLLLGG
ncbi:MAG: hypothetical protein M3067_12560 [Chloroflexota bacterium]|nr:hypothetical protein [Chloroflexota bacterium]